MRTVSFVYLLVVRSSKKKIKRQLIQYYCRHTHTHTRSSWPFDQIVRLNFQNWLNNENSIIALPIARKAFWIHWVTHFILILHFHSHVPCGWELSLRMIGRSLCWLCYSHFPSHKIAFVSIECVINRHFHSSNKRRVTKFEYMRLRFVLAQSLEREVYIESTLSLSTLVQCKQIWSMRERERKRRGNI